MKLFGHVLFAYLMLLAMGLALLIPIFLAIAVTGRPSTGFVPVLGAVITWVIAPISCGYMAIHATTRVFKIVNPRDLYIAFNGSYLTFSLVAILIGFLSKGSVRIFEFVQLALVISGSTIAIKMLGSRKDERQGES
jgi:hypothetical protein